MEALEIIAERHMHNLSRIEADHKKEIKGNDSKRAKEIEKINSRYASLANGCDEAYRSALGECNHLFLRRSAAQVLKSLRESAGIMRNHSLLSTLTPDQIGRANDAYILLSKADNENHLESLRRMWALSNTDPAVSAALDSLQKGNLGKLTISSYMGYPVSNGSNTIYLAVPAPLNDETALGKCLSDKVTSIIDARSVQIGKHVVLDKQMASSVNIYNLEFDCDFDEVHGFILYKMFLKDSSPGQAASAAKSLAEKINELQPKEFERLKLPHQVTLLDYEVLKFYESHSESEIFDPSDEIYLMPPNQKHISVDRAARIMGTDVKVIRTYVSKKILEGDHEMVEVASVQMYFDRQHGLVQEEHNVRVEVLEKRAYERLEAAPPVMDVNQAASVLGYKPRGVYGLIYGKRLDAEQEGTRLFLKKDTLRGFMEQNHLTMHGWKQVA